MTGLTRRQLLAGAAGALAATPLLALDARRLGAVRRGAVELAGPIMGSRYRVMLPELPVGSDPRALAARVRATLTAVDRAMSTYRPESEISRVNRARSTDWLAVSPATATVVARALEIGRLSRGAFDVAVAPLVSRWGFGAPIGGGPGTVRVRRTPPALAKSRPEVAIDLSGIAKGYALDCLGGLFRAAGIADYLIDIGGEIKVRGAGPAGRPWRLGIEHPREQGAIYAVVGLGQGALATSGDYRDYYEVAGRRYSHIIDPRAGGPVRHRLASVSVVAATTMEADALATALMVLGPVAGPELAAAEGVAALFLSRRGDRLEETTTPAFAGYRQG